MTGQTLVAYAGGPAAHGAVASERLFPDATLVPLPSFHAVAQATIAGETTFGVLAIESSLAGTVVETHDLLHDSPLSIVGETTIPIRHQLVGKADIPLTEVRTVRSHPSALEQCRRLLDAMPQAQRIAAATTADAAEQVALTGAVTEVAIASERAAGCYGLHVIATDVGDDPDVHTRFVSFAPYTRLDGAGRLWRTAFSFATDHRAGALHSAIEPFARHGIDLVQIVSRPLPQTTWRYRFDAVLAGHPLDERTSAALAEVRERVVRLRVFGSYPSDAVS